MNIHTMRLTTMTAAAIMLLTTGCHGKNETAVPRPTAYPRVKEYGISYASADSLPLVFEVNREAALHHPRPGWLNIDYTAYGATVFVTMIHAQDQEETDNIISNRLERMRMNINDPGNSATVEIANGAFSSKIVRSMETTSTPLQFISTDGHGWIVSGAAFFHDIRPGASLDSLSPMVSAIERDLRHALSSLDYTGR